MTRATLRTSFKVKCYGHKVTSSVVFIRLIFASSSFGKQNAVPVWLQAGGGIPCRPNPAAALFVLITYFRDAVKQKTGSRLKGHLVQLSWVWSGAVIVTTTRLNSTGQTAKCWESQNLWQLDQLSWDELRVVITAPDRTQLNQLSWVELSPVGRCSDQGLSRLFTMFATIANSSREQLQLSLCIFSGKRNCWMLTRWVLASFWL